MRVLLEIPTNKEEEFLSIVAFAKTCKRLKVAVCWNGNGRKKSKYVRVINKKKSDRPSMVGLRKAIFDANPGFDYRIIGDGDFVFRDGTEDYLMETAADLAEINSRGVQKFYIGMRSFFGAKKNKYSVVVVPIFQMSNGIMYTGNPWKKMKVLEGGFEEYYLTAVLFTSGQMPLKRYKSPIKHISSQRDTGSFIHSSSIWAKNNEKQTAILFNDPFWRLPKFMGDNDRSGRLKGKEYFHKLPIKAYPEIKRRRREMLKSGLYPDLIKKSYLDKNA